jgi:hypothetical protein
VNRHTKDLTIGNSNIDLSRIRADLKTVNPVLASTLARAVPKNARTPERDELTGKSDKGISQFKLEKLSSIISNNINAATDLRAITPYIGKAETIWQTMLLYPNGRQDKILSYDTQSSPYKSAKLHTELVAIWDAYYTNGYKIEGDLKKIVSDLLINTGSYALFNLSRPGLDYLINGSQLREAGVAGVESFIGQAQEEFSKEFTITTDKKVLLKNKGAFIKNPHESHQQVSGIESIFGKGPSYAGDEFRLFSDAEDPEKLINITFTDNPSALFLQKISAGRRDERVKQVSGFESLDLLIGESFKDKPEEADTSPKKPDKKDTTAGGQKGNVTKGKTAASSPKTQNLSEGQIEQVSAQMFRSRNIASQFIQYVKPSGALDTAPYGRGLTFHLPSECLIPIHFNGGNGRTAPDYIALLDTEDGSFLKNTNDFEFYQSIGANKEKSGAPAKNGSMNSLIQNLRKVQEGKECDFDMREFAEVSKANLIRAFSASVLGGNGDNISIEIDEEVNKIFLQRMFRGQGVRCLYIPGEALTYMALNFNRLGIGQSLVNMAKSHITRLAMFDLADTLSNLEKATPHSMMTVRLNANAPEPMADIANARNTFFEANPTVHNILMMTQLSVPQMIDSLREASLTVKVDPGENPYFPGHDVQIDHMDRNNFPGVDQNSRNELLNKIASYLQLQKSWLDISDDQNNFQIEALAEHQMLLNQVVSYQAELGGFLADFQRKHAYVNAPLLKDLIAKIREQKKLWKPDSGQTLEGNEQQQINLILADFISNVICKLPTPTSIETTNKIKDSLQVVNELVKNWMDMAGGNGTLSHVGKLLGFIKGDDGSPEEDIDPHSLAKLKGQIQSVFLRQAYIKYNLPMPFDDVLAGGEGGGLASLVNEVVQQHQNTGEFLAAMMVGMDKADVAVLKKHWKNIEKSKQDLLQAKDKTTGQAEPDDSLTNGDGIDNPPVDPDADPALTDDPALVDDDTLAGGGGEEEEEEEDEEPPVNDDDANKDASADDDNKDGTDPSKNDPGYQPFKP